MPLVHPILIGWDTVDSCPVLRAARGPVESLRHLYPGTALLQYELPTRVFGWLISVLFFLLSSSFPLSLFPRTSWQPLKKKPSCSPLNPSEKDTLVLTPCVHAPSRSSSNATFHTKKRIHSRVVSSSPCQNLQKPYSYKLAKAVKHRRGEQPSRK